MLDYIHAPLERRWCTRPRQSCEVLLHELKAIKVITNSMASMVRVRIILF
jgi:hypothetical protein